MSDTIFKEIGEIWSRLFDHKPFVHGEIKFIIREFEEKRSEREVENLFSILEKLTNFEENLFKRIQKVSECSLNPLNNKLEEALNICKDIDKDILAQQKENEETLSKGKKERKIEWQQFIEDMNFKHMRIDNAFDEKEEELKEFYADLDHKLKITK